MDLNSTSCTSDYLVFRIQCYVVQYQAGLLKNGWNGGIMFHDYNQGLSGYRSKWLEEDGVWDSVWARVGVKAGNGLPLTLTPPLVGLACGLGLRLP